MHFSHFFFYYFNIFLFIIQFGNSFVVIKGFVLIHRQFQFNFRLFFIKRNSNIIKNFVFYYFTGWASKVRIEYKQMLYNLFQLWINLIYIYQIIIYLMLTFVIDALYIIISILSLYKTQIIILLFTKFSKNNFHLIVVTYHILCLIIRFHGHGWKWIARSAWIQNMISCWLSWIWVYHP